MEIIYADSINQAFLHGLDLLLSASTPDNSRNGNVIRIRTPVTTCYTHPRRRVLNNALRNANPFFHLMESMWMLAGRNDIKFVKLFNSRMAQYSDDAVTQPAAYGHRWRKHFGNDQLNFVIDELKRDPNTRRAIMTMSDPVVDIEAVQHGGRDVPCNTSVYFIRRSDGRLDMTVSNRSNDAIWGAYGANMVHMSFLHEYVAMSIGVGMGRYYQVSNDLHAYTDVFSAEQMEAMMNAQDPKYHHEPLALWQRKEHREMFDADLETFFDFYDNGNFAEITEPYFVSQWFATIVAPMFQTWLAYKAGDRDLARLHAAQIGAADWQEACSLWLANAWATKDAK